MYLSTLLKYKVLKYRPSMCVGLFYLVLNSVIFGCVLRAFFGLGYFKLL